MKTQILIALLIVLVLLFGCTQEQPVVVNNTNLTPTDTNTNITTENQIIEQELNEGWINENELIDTGSVI